jgi:uncharacterized protein (UPF0210 family)
MSMTGICAEGFDMVAIVVVFDVEMVEVQVVVRV